MVATGRYLSPVLHKADFDSANYYENGIRHSANYLVLSFPRISSDPA